MITRAKAEDAHTVLLSKYMGEIDKLPLEFDKLDQHVLTALYHSAARATHPDTGGTSEAFARVDWAKHVLLKWLEKPRSIQPSHKRQPCHACGGAGFLRKHSGFRPGARVQCITCHGSGDADYDYKPDTEA
jgi:hypothetical protein